MQVHDIKTTVTHTLWIDSKNAEGRKDPNTGKLLNWESNHQLIFNLKHTQHSLIGLAVSRVRIDTRIPRMNTKERTAYIMQSTTSPNGPFQLVEIKWPSRGTHNQVANHDPLVHVGIKGDVSDFIATHNNNTTPFDMELVPAATDGHLAYASTDASIWVAPVDCAFYRRLGFTDFPNSQVVDGVTYKFGTPMNNANVILGGKSHDYRVPPLYLHADLDVNSEQGQRHQNIIYRVIINDKDLYGYNSASDEIPAYIDADRVVTPIELNNKFLPTNKLRLSWHYEDGSLADLHGAEWSCKLELISAVAQH